MTAYEVDVRALRLWPLPVWLVGIRVAGGRRSWSVHTPWDDDDDGGWPRLAGAAE